MNSIKKTEFLKDYEVKLIFDDSYSFVIDLKEFFKKGFARELLEKNKFEQLYIESGGGLAWPNGFDICPVFLRNIADKKDKELSA